MSNSAAMSWPTPAHFATVLQDPKIAFRNSALKKIRIVSAKGQPRARAGRFACVYEGILPTGEKRAIRVFTGPMPERRERYQAVSEYLVRCQPQSLVRFTYEDKGIRSAGDGKWYPLITMDWVEGETLYEWVRHRCLDKDAQSLSRASNQWIEIVQELARVKIAHGDLQQDNVMVAPSGRLKLVDYDCMCVPALVGRKNLEIGVEPYQHPQRNENTALSLNLDNFSAWLIFVALKALAANPGLWANYVERDQYDKLLFRREDFAAPDKSALVRDLQRSPDQEVQRLSRELLGLVRVPMDQVPSLDAALFSWPAVRTLLDERDFDGAIELVQRNRKTLAEAPPPLPARLQEAHQRVQQRLGLEKAVEAGDEAAMQRLYQPKLLDDYPRALPAVAIARGAAQVISLLVQLQQKGQAGQWRDFVKVWDANRRLLGDRKSAQQYGAAAKTWRQRNEACDAVLTMMRQPAVSVEALEAAWSRLAQLGGHPDAVPLRPRVEQVLQRAHAWSAVLAVPRIASEENDRRLLQAWNEPLFAGWAEAEARRPWVVQARQRLAVVDRLEQQTAQADAALTLDAERAVAKLAEGLGDYQYKVRPRIEQARLRVAGGERLLSVLQAPASDLAIVQAWQELGRVHGRKHIPKAHHARISLALKRTPLLLALRRIPRDYTIQQAPELDSRIVETWDNRLLADCRDAEPWRKAYQAACRRRQILAQLQAAIQAGEKTKIVDLASADCMNGYPLPFEWQSVVAQATVGVRAARELLEVLRAQQQSRFHAAFDARIIRENEASFSPFHPVICQWLPEEVLPAAKIGLGLPLGRRAIVVEKQRRSPSYRVCWNWPHPRFSEKCLLAVCRDRPEPRDNPAEMPVQHRHWVDRKRYEDGSGSVSVAAARGKPGSYLVVWAAVELGQETFYSEPLILGRMERDA